MNVITGDVTEVLPMEGFDACLCDPPYGLKFMGKAWDHGVPSADTWRKVYDSLKPGGMLLAFGGTRTHHRLMVAIEDAGFEIRDCLMWLYGSGFPKSHNLSGKFDGYGTALKPAWEPIVLAMKPCDGTFANNALEHGVAGLNVDGGRIAGDDHAKAWDKPVSTNISASDYVNPTSRHTVDLSAYRPSGRWPANVILDAESGKLLDAQSGDRESGSRAAGVRHGMGYHGANGDGGPAINKSSGGASRFYYCAKASRAERNAGLNGMPEVAGATNHALSRGKCADCGEWGDAGEVRCRCGGSLDRKANPASVQSNHHPTVKPLDLCRYLATLIKPPEPGKLLVPFCGSGSEMIGAHMAGWTDVTGIELNEEYADIARARIAHHTAQQRMAFTYRIRGTE